MFTYKLTTNIFCCFLGPSETTNVTLTSKVHLKIKFYLLDVAFINNLLK